MRFLRSRALVLAAAVVALGLGTALWVRNAPHRPPDPGRELSGAAQALDFWAAQRAYPHPVIPDVGYALAWEAERSRLAGGPSGFDDLVAPWTVLGPANIGGRTLCLAIRPDDPNVLFAGSASGGLWKTTTAGVGADAWDYVETGFPVNGVSTIALDPSDPDVMYIGTGEVYRYQGSIGGRVIRTTRGSYGIGILKSADAGASWTKSLDWTLNQTRGVWMIKVHPTNSSIVYAATTEGTYKSVNAGASWTLVHGTLMATDVRLHPTMPETVFVACGNLGSAGNGIYRSFNGGGTWTKLAGGLPASWSGKAQLDIALTAPSTMYASIADSSAGRGLYRSTNGGTSWTRVNATDYPTYQGWYSHYVLVSPFDANRVWVGGIDLWRSTNGGTTLSQRSDWTGYYLGAPPPEGPAGDSQYAHADQHFAVWHPTDPNVVYFASDGGVYRTLDGGTVFRSLNGHLVTTQFYNGFANSAGDPDLAMGGLQDNFTAIYRGGPAWERVIGGDGCMTAIHPTDDTKMYAEYQYLAMLRSSDDGANWDYIEPPSMAGDLSPFVGPFALSPSNPSVLYAGRSRVYKTTNEGNTWSATGGGSPLSAGNAVHSLAVCATGPDTAYAATAPIVSAARVFRTRNGGASWTDVTGSLPDRYPSDLAVDPNDGDRVFVAFSGFGTSHAFRSENGGATWTDIGGGLPDVPTSAIEVDPDHPEVIYLGNDIGVYLSLDGGGTWQAYSSGMPTAQVSDLKVFRPSRLLRAATHGNGVFERPLADPSVTSVADLPAATAGPLSLAVAPNPLRPDSRIVFRLGAAARVRLALYDATGRRVRLLLDEERAAGEHAAALEPASLAPGVYYAKLETSAGTAMTRVVFAR